MFKGKGKKFLILFSTLLIFLLGLVYLVLNSNMSFKAKLLDKLPFMHYGLHLTKAFNIFYVPVMDVATDTATWDLKINKNDLNKLNEDIPEDFLSNGYKEKIEVKAKLYIDGEEYKVKVKYRGATPTHWAWAKKSWLINFDKDKRYKGIDKINLIVPKNVGFFMDTFNNYRAKKFGLIAPYHDLINLTINGRNKSFYYLSEKWSPELLARNEKPDSSNLYCDKDHSLNLYEDLKSWGKCVESSSMDEKDVSDLKDLMDAYIDRDIDTVESLIDIDNFIAWNTMALISGSRRQDNGHNITMLSNNSTGKFEMVPDDVYMIEFVGDPNDTNNGHGLSYSPGTWHSCFLLWDSLEQKDFQR